jgi:hypothetical protein
MLLNKRWWFWVYLTELVEPCGALPRKCLFIYLSFEPPIIYCWRLIAMFPGIFQRSGQSFQSSVIEMMTMTNRIDLEARTDPSRWLLTPCTLGTAHRLRAVKSRSAPTMRIYPLETAWRRTAGDHVLNGPAFKTFEKPDPNGRGHLKDNRHLRA